MREKYEDGPPNVENRDTASMRGVMLPFTGGPVDTSGMRASHNGPTPTTVREVAWRDVDIEKGETPVRVRNAKLTRPAEQYPGEAERMIDTWTKLATTAIVKARDATDEVRLVSHLEEAAHAIGEALRWAKP
jgi:hypothetical protein